MLKKLREIFSPRKKKTDPDKTLPAVQRGPKVVHHEIPVSDLDPDAVKIVQRLTRFDHSAYLVGGCVRDLLLDRHPKDFDLGTSATPRQVRRLFRNCRIIGRRFRLAHVYFQNGKIIEVATFRSRNGTEFDVSRKEADDLLIRDDNQFGTPEEDALRRDFTINSLFYDVNNGNVLDHADGLADLRRKLVRTIGDPVVRFREDPIRILRAIKFAARLDFKIESETLAAIQKTRSEIPKAASPRILEEINRFCREGKAGRCFELMRETGVFDVVLPELADGYRDQGSWDLLLDLMGRIDRATGDRKEISTGVFLAVLLLPALEAALGWKRDGTAEQPRSVKVRETIDSVLRPLALRLRVARRDQEECRQIISILFRQVPPGKLRPAGRRALARRTALPQTVPLLEILAARYGGDFAAAYDEWKDEPGRAPRKEPRGREPSGGEGRSGRRRRSRSGRRRKRREADGAGEERTPSRAKQAPKPSADLPKPWDDNYFFAALPNAPEMAAEDGSKDRYGAATVAAQAEPPAETGSEAAAEGARDGEGRGGDEARPRRRRRRSRGGRRRRSGGGGEKDAETSTTTKESDE